MRDRLLLRLLSSYHRYNIARCRRRFSSATQETDVVIVGGGPTGLLLSNLLSQYKARHILLESKAESECYSHPQAHYINLRSMEILRYNTPKVYARVKNALRPVEEWEHFRFGTSVLNGKLLGKVKHDVLPGNKDSHPSACYVGHLAQNKFCKMLLDEARSRLKTRLSADGNILFETQVSAIHQSDKDEDYAVQVKYVQPRKNTFKFEAESRHSDENEYSIKCKFAIACDGAHSLIRRNGGIPMEGDNAIQHLLNVYFRTIKGSQLHRELENIQNCGMLHFVYNQKCIVVFVSHDVSEGEWVAQIPIFPPFLDASDYTEENILELLYYGLLGSKLPARLNDIDIISIRPWCMSSLVAASYDTGPGSRVFLAGDAAHAFPPAGGFGMNTGLQDAHNIAWKLALAIKSDLLSPLMSYNDERRPIAMANAALSVRNYERTLNIARTLGLDAKYSTTAINSLKSTPLNMLPLGARKKAFHNMMKLAMLPLSQVENNGFYSSFMSRRVQGILDRKEGLPLLFPAYELGFSYRDSNGKRTPLGEESDNAQYISRLSEGHRVPHCEIELRIHPRKMAQHYSTISSITDIPAQIQDESGKPVFAVVCPASFLSRGIALNPAGRVFSLRFLLVYQYDDQIIDLKTNKMEGSNELSSRALHFIDTNGDWKIAVENTLQSSSSDFTYDDSAVVVRPDGHVLKIHRITEMSTQFLEKDVVEYIDSFLSNLNTS